MSVRLQKKQLWAQIEEAIEKEEKLVRRKKQLQNQLSNVNDQLDKVWEGDCFQFSVLYNCVQKIKLSGFMMFRKCTRPVIELVYERIVEQYNTMLDCDGRRILEHNIQVIEDYMNKGFPEIKSCKTFDTNIAVGYTT